MADRHSADWRRTRQSGDLGTCVSLPITWYRRGGGLDVSPKDENRAQSTESVYAGGNMSIGSHARNTPDHPALIVSSSGETLTYRELDERSNRLARLLQTQGVRRGDT